MVVAVLILIFLQTIAQLFLPTLLSDIVDTGIVNGDTGYIVRMGIIMLLVAAAGGACTIASSYFAAKVSAGFGRDLRLAVFTRVENYALYEFNSIGTASLITRTTNDITQVQRVIMMMLRMLASAPMMLVGGIIMAVSKNARLSLVIVAAAPILSGAVLFVARRGTPLFKALQNKLDALNRVLRENLTGIRVIRAFNRIDYERRRFDQANQDLTRTAVTVNRLMAVMHPIIMLIMNGTIIAVIWFGGIRINSGSLQVGDLMAFIQYVMQIMFSLVAVSMVFVMIPRAAASAARVNKVLETVPRIKDPEQPRLQTEQPVSVELDNVTFSYPGAEEPAVKNISFTARPGQVTAIIGSTGSGKSTLINLIMRFYDVDSGSIKVGGVDVRQLTQAALRQKIGLVPQQAVLFTGTVADNIRYGKDDASDEEITKAAETAQALEFVTSMPQGFNSLVSQGGTNLSGGQKQRLAIARALVRRPEVYLFDDCFSALDFATDARLRRALKKETKNSVVIIVAQRVSTIMDADQIVVLDHGQVVGIGTHDELLRSCDVYREIVSSQLSEEEIA